MKKYFIAVAALAFLAACNGKVAKDTPVLVEEESIAVAEAAPDAPSLPELPVVKAKPAKPINMRDSLKLDRKGCGRTEKIQRDCSGSRWPRYRLRPDFILSAR